MIRSGERSVLIFWVVFVSILDIDQLYTASKCNFIVAWKKMHVTFTIIVF